MSYRLIMIVDLLNDNVGPCMDQLLFASRALEDNVNMEELTEGSCNNPLKGLAAIMVNAIETYNEAMEEIERIRTAPDDELLAWTGTKAKQEKEGGELDHGA